jgi:putative membrane protein
VKSSSRRNLWKGLLAGAAAGLAGSYAMGEFHSLVNKAESSTAGNEVDSTVRVASAIWQTIFHRQLTPPQKAIAGPIVHYMFGGTVGAIYGTAAEYTSVVRTGWGIPFGVMVWLGAHVIVVPALGLSAPVNASPPQKEAAELGAHIVYGTAVESIRHSVRRHLLR